MRTSILFAAAGLVCAARADVTLRQQMTMKFSSLVPQEVQDGARKQSAAAMPGEILLRIKGDKSYGTFGTLAAITDYKREEVTLLDAKTKRYATVPLSEYADRMAAALKLTAPAAQTQQALQGIQMDVQTKKTGQVGLVKGIQAEETLITLTVRVPSAQQAAASTMRMELRYWIAMPSEIRRIGALNELADYVERSRKAFDTAQFLEQATASLPGMAGDQVRAAVREMLAARNGFPLKNHTAVFVPAIAQSLQLAPQPPAGFDPNAPLAESDMDVAELSTDPVPDSVFAVPADYEPAPFEELVKAAMATSPLVPWAGNPQK